MTHAYKFLRSNCPVAVSLDILGDKWTLLVVRDLFVEARRYNDFLQSPENIPTNILADRLKRLVAHGVVKKTAYNERPKRYEYELTAKGRTLGPLVKEMVAWANLHYPKTYNPYERGKTKGVKLKSMTRT